MIWGMRFLVQSGPWLPNLAPAWQYASARFGFGFRAVIARNRTPPRRYLWAQKIVHCFEEPVRIDDTVSIDAGVGVGIATAPGRRADARSLLQHADVALLWPISAGGEITVYDAAFDPFEPENLSLVGELHHKISRDELQSCTKPKISLRLSRQLMVRSLVRWIHPRHGFLPPDRFIPWRRKAARSTA